MILNPKPHVLVEITTVAGQPSNTLFSMAEALGEMTDVQRSTLTIHVHLSMQSVSSTT